MLYLNSTPVRPTMFPDKTSQVWKLPFDQLQREARITWKFENEGEFLQLCQLVELIRHYSAYEISLQMLYLPYGRQDKLVDNRQTFALHAFADALNNLGIERITCLDPHSDVAGKLIDNFEAVFPMEEIMHAVTSCSPDILCFPDLGASKRYKREFKDWPIAVGEKKRDPMSGWITEYQVLGGVSGKDKILIIDDICDGGMTFILLAQKLLEMGASEVNLYVTHGIFSKGLKPLKDAGINRIFTWEGEKHETLSDASV